MSCKVCTQRTLYERRRNALENEIRVLEGEYVLKAELYKRHKPSYGEENGVPEHQLCLEKKTSIQKELSLHKQKWLKNFALLCPDCEKCKTVLATLKESMMATDEISPSIIDKQGDAKSTEETSDVGKLYSSPEDDEKLTSGINIEAELSGRNENGDEPKDTVNVDLLLADDVNVGSPRLDMVNVGAESTDDMSINAVLAKNDNPGDHIQAEAQSKHDETYISVAVENNFTAPSSIDKVSYDTNYNQTSAFKVGTATQYKHFVDFKKSLKVKHGDNQNYKSLTTKSVNDKQSCSCEIVEDPNNPNSTSLVELQVQYRQTMPLDSEAQRRSSDDDTSLTSEDTADLSNNEVVVSEALLPGSREESRGMSVDKNEKYESLSVEAGKLLKSNQASLIIAEEPVRKLGADDENLKPLTNDIEFKILSTSDDIRDCSNKETITPKIKKQLKSKQTPSASPIKATGMQSTEDMIDMPLTSKVKFEVFSNSDGTTDFPYKVAIASTAVKQVTAGQALSITPRASMEIRDGNSGNFASSTDEIEFGRTRSADNGNDDLNNEATVSTPEKPTGSKHILPVSRTEAREIRCVSEGTYKSPYTTTENRSHVTSFSENTSQVSIKQETTPNVETQANSRHAAQNTPKDCTETMCAEDEEYKSLTTENEIDVPSSFENITNDYSSHAAAAVAVNQIRSTDNTAEVCRVIDADDKNDFDSSNSSDDMLNDDLCFRTSAPNRRTTQCNSNKKNKTSKGFFDRFSSSSKSKANKEDTPKALKRKIKELESERKDLRSKVLDYESKLKNANTKIEELQQQLSYMYSINKDIRKRQKEQYQLVKKLPTGRLFEPKIKFNKPSIAARVKSKLPLILQICDLEALVYSLLGLQVISQDQWSEFDCRKGNKDAQICHFAQCMKDIDDRKAEKVEVALRNAGYNDLARSILSDSE